MITREEVLKLLEYDPVTGVFTWKVSPTNRVKVGAEAGWVQVYGGKSYLTIQVNGRTYKAHRLAWLVLTGNFPEDQIDHINGQGLDNRSINLRSVSNAENGKNQRKHVTNTSGVTGVYWDKAYAKWMAAIRLNGKRKNLGRFDNFDEAVEARKNAERKLGYHPRHGETRPL